MNEAETRAELIDPALKDAGWGVVEESRILFLADRNILSNQAFNAFSVFDEDGRVRIEPDAITKKGRVPKNGRKFQRSPSTP